MHIYNLGMVIYFTIILVLLVYVVASPIYLYKKIKKMEIQLHDIEKRLNSK